VKLVFITKNIAINLDHVTKVIWNPGAVEIHMQGSSALPCTLDNLTKGGKQALGLRPQDGYPSELVSSGEVKPHNA
jgi:hypothetical protein